MAKTSMTRRNLVKGATVAGVGAAAAMLAGCANDAAQTAAQAAVKPVILVTSFGTSYASSRHSTIGAIESAIRERFQPTYDVRRAFTSDTIIDILKERDGISIDNVDEAISRCIDDGVRTLVVQPTHLMEGYEYTDLADALEKVRDSFDDVVLGRPLLDTQEDLDAVADALTEELADYDDGSCALVLMGHGTESDANGVYAALQKTFDARGQHQFFVGTVEAEPTCDDVIRAVTEAGYTRAALSPLMVVAGDHATNDMADRNDPESWVSRFEAAGIETTCILAGLGQYAGIDSIYVDHVSAAIDSLKG